VGRKTLPATNRSVALVGWNIEYWEKLE